MSVITTVFLGYLIILIVVAAWSRKESTTLQGYFIAGKKLPPWVVAFSTNATGESGWLLLGLTGMGYAVGVHAFWVVLGEVAGISLAWILISRRLKRLGDKTDSITVPDVLAARFDDKNHVLRSISVLIILVMVMTYVAAGRSVSRPCRSPSAGRSMQAGRGHRRHPRRLSRCSPCPP